MFQDSQRGIPHILHDTMQAAVSFIAIITFLVKIKAYTRQHSNGTIDDAYYSGNAGLRRMLFYIIASPLALLAFQYARLS